MQGRGLSERIRREARQEAQRVILEHETRMHGHSKPKAVPFPDQHIPDNVLAGIEEAIESQHLSWGEMFEVFDAWHPAVLAREMGRYRAKLDNWFRSGAWP